MKDVFESDLFKEFTNDILPHINEKDSVNDDTIETILPGVLHEMDQINNVIKRGPRHPYGTPEDNTYQVYRENR